MLLWSEQFNYAEHRASFADSGPEIIGIVKLFLCAEAPLQPFNLESSRIPIQ